MKIEVSGILGLTMLAGATAACGTATGAAVGAGAGAAIGAGTSPRAPVNVRPGKLYDPLSRDHVESK